MLGDPRLNTECRSRIQSRDPHGSRTREPGAESQKAKPPERRVREPVIRSTGEQESVTTESQKTSEPDR